MSTRGHKHILTILLGGGIAVLVIHFVIYFLTGASAFINQPTPYFTGFTVRDGRGNFVKEVSYAVGFGTYITAMLAVLMIGGGLYLWKRRSPSKP